MKLGGIVAATVLGASLLAAGPAFSDPKHCPPGHAKKNWCRPGADFRGPSARDHDDDWERERAYEEGYRDGQRDAWRIGDRMSRDRYRVVPDYYEYGWPAPRDGRAYVRADDRYYLIELATGAILDILTR